MVFLLLVDQVVPMVEALRVLVEPLVAAVVTGRMMLMLVVLLVAVAQCESSGLAKMC
jgi:hypothetical protein